MTAALSSNPIFIMDKCYNSAPINALSTSYGANNNGGLMVMISPSSKLTECYNTGNLTMKTKSQYTGGLVGYYSGSFNANAFPELLKCYNTGNITTGSTYCGGIVGYASNYMTITDCFNAGNIISSTQYAGGITARNGNYVKIVNTNNSGNITSPDNYIAGITA